MSANRCTSYSPGHNVHFIQVKRASQYPNQVRSVQLVDIEGRWFQVRVDGEFREGWHHSAKAVHEFFQAAEINRALADGWYYPEEGLAAGLGPATLRDLQQQDGYQGQILRHEASGGALSVNLGDNGRAFLSVCWKEPERCHVNIINHADGSVTVS